MKSSILALGVALASFPAFAQGYVAPPAPIAGTYTSANGMSNVATLYVTACAVGMHICAEHRVEAWGQVCDPGTARRAGNEFAGSMMHYASWRCVLEVPTDTPPYGTEGLADEWPDPPPYPAWVYDPDEIAKHRIGDEAVVGHVIGSSSGKAPFLMPRECHVLNERGRPVKTWWVRSDGSCHVEDATN